MSHDSTGSIPLENWQGALTKRYPLGSTVGFACHAGWRNILARLLDRLQAAVNDQPAEIRETFRIDDIKEKFGYLTIHLTHREVPAIQSAVREAEEASLITCEVCGEPGRLAERRAWWSVRCAAHENWVRMDGYA